MFLSLMKSPLRSSHAVAISAFAAALFAFHVPAFAAGSHNVSVETIRQLKLSGFNDDAHGGLQWRLEADTATADSSDENADSDVLRARWNLGNLRLFTFGKDGKVFAEMTSPAGVFLPNKKTADSDAPVEVKGKNFRVRGNGWAWTGLGHDNLVRVRENVFVALSQPEKKETLTALADSLTIRGEDDQTVLIFSGNVKVSYGEIFMTCATLEIFVSEKGSRVPAETNEISSGRDAFADAVRQIVGHGNVEITRGTARISGKTTEFFPRENLFVVRGNARLDDSAGKISVSGEKAVGKIDRHFVEIFSEDDERESEKSDGAEKVVSVEMPSFAARQKTSEQNEKNEISAERAFVTGKRMTVHSTAQENTISLFENVRATDQGIKIESEQLVVTTDPSSENPLPQVVETDATTPKISVRTVVAEGNVRADYSGRVLRCARAEIFPQTKLITLAGAPNIISENEEAALSGDHAEVFLDRDVIEVYSATGENENRTRVVATLPPVSATRANGVPAKNSPAGTGKTTIVGDRLTLTRGKDLSTFDIFGNVSMRSDSLEGKCGRVVVFADPNPEQKNSRKTSRKNVSKIKKIIADEDVRLEQNGYVLTGGRAIITPAVDLKEWVNEDQGSDAGTPFFVVVEPSETAADTVRPRISFNSVGGASLDFSLPSAKGISSSKKGKNASENSFLESDKMELIAEESRARFFLRGNVKLSSESGAQGGCDTVEGLAARQENDADGDGFEAKKVICRGNVHLSQDGSSGSGSTLEIFPPENRAVLSGNAVLRDKGGIVLHPGNDRFVIDLEKRQLITGAAAGTGDETPEQVSRPRIVIPAGSDRVFVIPKSVQRTEKN